MTTLLAFNRGLVSRLAAARVDLKRMALSASVMKNWMPRVLGSMMLRPGLGYVGATKDNAAALHIPFVFAVDDTAIIELTSGLMRVRVDDEIITRPSVSATISNGTFTSNLTGWTDSDKSGCASTWATGGYLSLTGDGSSEARRDKEITVTETGIEHALDIVVAKGPVTLRVGSTRGGSEYMSATLQKGHHSIAFTPTGNFHIRFAASRKTAALVDSVAIGYGDMEIATDWTDLQDIRHIQSGDVVFIASHGIKQKRIERRDTNSWSVVDYVTEDGPWRIQNTDEQNKFTPSDLSGSITLAASKDTFESGNVGSLIKISSVGQYVEAELSAEDTYTNYVRVTGVNNGRKIYLTFAGAWSGRLTVERSVGAPGDWTEAWTRTGNDTETYDDNLDNQVVYYRIGFQPGEYTSGTAEVSISYDAGSIEGIVEITGYTDAKNVIADVINDLGGTDGTPNWSEGAWSPRRGYPSAVEIHDGRLWWAGKDNVWGSVSDAYNSFDDSIEGDSAPISRSIGSGPVDKINWLMSANNLLVGGQGAEHLARSSSLDEPLTATNFGLKEVSTLGSANMPAAKIDTSTVFVNRNGSRAYEIAYDGQGFKTDDLTSIIPEIGASSFCRIAVQRQPDTRIHLIREDGTVAVLLFDKTENVTCWLELETDGEVEDVIVLPATTEDAVYYTVKRTIDGSTVRYLEKFSLESQAVGGEDCRLADSHIVYSGASTDTITGLDHLEGESVVVWGNSKDLGSYTVSGGSITLSEAVAWCCVGLVYTAPFKGAKIQLSQETPIGKKQKITSVGLMLVDTHAQGLKIGTDFDTMDDLPQIHEGAVVDLDSVWDEFEVESVTAPGGWSLNTRLCLQAASPRPCTVLAVVVNGL